jgi:hypothetical protein
MKPSAWKKARRLGRQVARWAFAALPEDLRFRVYRRMMNVEPPATGTLVLKIASTRAELEACFALLHDAYVASGFMQPHPSGLRVTPYHALPTTTTLCAKLDGRVVGTLSIVREGVFGFPMQTAFDISAVRAKPGQIAEISALAIHPSCRKTGGSILFPLMKFMHEYCVRYFDTRHLLIAVNPNKIEMYESLLFFRRLEAQTVDRYDFANGAPAVGATLDLHEARAIFERAYGGMPGRRNLHRYFFETTLDAIQFPSRPWHTTNDPVLTPALMDHFFNHRVPVLQALDERKQLLLHSIYPGKEWTGVLPPCPAHRNGSARLRQHPRFTVTCPARVGLPDTSSADATIIEISRSGFVARTPSPLQVGMLCDVQAELGTGVSTRVAAQVVRTLKPGAEPTFGFRVEQPDDAWQQCSDWLEITTVTTERPVGEHPPSPAPAPSGIGRAGHPDRRTSRHARASA